MKKFKLLLLALMCVAFLPSKADEGMWLLQLMQEQIGRASCRERV